VLICNDVLSWGSPESSIGVSFTDHEMVIIPLLFENASVPNLKSEEKFSLLKVVVSQRLAIPEIQLPRDSSLMI